MNISDKTSLKTYLCLAISLTISAGYLFYFNHLNTYELLIISFVIFSLVEKAYRRSEKFKENNTLNKLITLNDNVLVCKSTNGSSTKTIDMDKISKVTVADNYLSIIELNNGNGYDIFLSSSSHHIMGYVSNLFKQNKIKNIELNYA